MNKTGFKKGVTEKKQWYLLAYDIRQPKRLSRTHYFIKKKAVGLQRSVFLVRANSDGLDEIVAGIQERVNDSEDDVRLYPIHKPGSIWAAGQQSGKIDHLYAAAPAKSGKGLIGRIRKLFSRGK